MSIKKRLMWFIIILFILPLVISFFYRFYVLEVRFNQTIHSVQKTMENTLLSNVDKVNKNIKRVIEQRKIYLSGLSNKIINLTTVRNFARYGMINSLQKELEKIMLTSDVDFVGVSTDKSTVIIGMGKENCSSLSLKDDIDICKDGTVVLYSYREISDGIRKIKVITGIFLNENFLSELKDMFGNDLILLVNDDIKASTFHVEKIKEMKKGVYSIGDTHIGKFSYIGNNTIKLGDFMETKDINEISTNLRNNLFSDLRKSESVLFIIWLLIIIIFFIITLEYIRRTFTPLDSVVNAINALGKEDFNIHLDIPVNAEMKHLVDSINHLKEDLRQSKEKDRRYLESLKKERKKLEDIILNISEGIILLDNNENVLVKNRFGAKVMDFFEGNGIDLTSTLQMGKEERNVLIDRKPRRILIGVKDIMDKDSQKIGRLVLLKDITADMEMKELTELNKRLAEREETALTMAHEIRNPLNVIGINLQILKEELGGKNTSSDHLDSIGIMLKEIQKVDTVIERYLYPRSILPLDGRICDVNNVIERIMNFFKYRFLDKNIKASILCNVSKPLVRGDEQRLNQLFFNLIANAIDAVGTAGGKVQVNIDTFKKEHIVVGISDNGKGLTEWEKKHLFNLSFTTKDNGNGFGLQIAKKIVEEHRGKIWFESDEDKGTCFYVLLPEA
ncbi:MAG: hypothetical protein DRP50_01045 [Thermotoga sp.]|nr:MAG: hypothetical protein DRP50_01045 [Thermotoga sp.]